MMKSKLLFTIMMTSLLLLGAVSCSHTASKIKSKKWGEVQGKEIYLYQLQNENGMKVELTNYGAIMVSAWVPDKDGKLEDVVLGFDNLQQYLEPNPCFGAAIGRFANRIRNAEFTIDSIRYQLTPNDHAHCAHGANEFNTAVWDAEIIRNTNAPAVRMHYYSKDGTNGFPGNVETTITYTLTSDNAIRVDFEAVTDKATHLNLTQHSYFNLSACKEDILNHWIFIDANRYTEIDEDIVPTGVIASVVGTDWDLTQFTRIGDNIGKLKHDGYHFNYIFNKAPGQMKKVIQVIEPTSGRTLDVSTTQPGVQFYTGNAISDQLVGKYGIAYKPHMAFCLETQHFPDTPHHDNFPSTLLRPGEKYQQTVIYDFGIKPPQ